MATVLTLVPRGGHPDFLDLPWSTPLAEWDHPRVVRMARGPAATRSASSSTATGSTR